MTTIIDFHSRIGIDADAVNKIDADYVLERAIGELKEVLVLGIDKDGRVYFSCSSDNVAGLNLALDWVKHYLVTNHLPEE